MAEIDIQDSDVDSEVAKDCQNFKGLLYDKPDDKYYDPINGAHFQYEDLCHRIS